MRTQIFSIFFLLGIFISNTLLSNTDFFLQEKITEKESITVFPNPINEKGILKINLEDNTEVKIEFFDLGGKKVKELIKENFDAGEHKIEFKADDLKEGFYFCKISTGSWVKAKRFLVKR